MAKTRSKAFKKSKKFNTMNIAIFSLIGLLIVLIGTIVLFNIFGNSYQLNDWSELLNQQEEGIYFVYVHHPQCEACIIIRDEVAAFRKDNAMDIPVYYLNVSTATGVPPQQLDSTPTVVIVKNGQFYNTMVGIPEIRNLFNTVQNQTFQAG